MTNVIGYKQLPNYDEFYQLYVVEGKSQQELGTIYKCGKLRIRQWIKKFGLKTRNQGGGNNHKFSVDKKTLLRLVTNRYTNDEIADILGMSVSNVTRLLKKHSIKRELDIPKYRKYNNKVRRLTESNYAKYKEVINPNDYPRTLCGVVGGYQVDHIIEVRECFDNGISAEDCASLENLQMIPWETNLKKRKLKGFLK